MARSIIPINRFQGLSDAEKEGLTSTFLWAQSCDYRTDPGKLTILPKTEKVSGTVLLDLPVDATRYSTDTYFYGNAGHIYKRTSAEVWTDIKTVNDSHGNGISYFGEDGYIYYASDTTLGRYGLMSGTPQFVDAFMEAEGGIPLNTACMDFEASSSQYVTAADSATLSITSDMTIEACVKWESLPAAAASMTIVSKWNGDSDERSYMFQLTGVSAKFGDGGNGALTISSNTTETVTDSACTGTAAAYSLSATNASFATGDKILIHQSRGTNAGVWEQNEIASYTAGTITLSNALTNTYTSGAQVRVLPEYTNVTINNGITYTAKAWNGTVGGILAFLASGTVTVTGTITASAKGYRGGNGIAGGGSGSKAYSGEGTSGAQAQQRTPNGNGGGGGQVGASGDSGGGGGGNGTAGQDGYGVGSSGGSYGIGGYAVGSTDLTTMEFGGGGGGGAQDTDPTCGNGGTGGGIIFITGATTTITGTITSTGSAGGSAGDASGGGGAGGSILIKAQVATLGTSLVTAAGGSGPYSGGNGAVGRIHLDYYTSYTGTTSPTLDVVQDSNLVTSTVYQLRFWVSSDGTTTNQECLAKEIITPTLAHWYRYAVTWDASASKATFFIDGVNQGYATGAKTGAYDSTALFAIGANFGAAGSAENFIDAKIDDVRLFDDIRTDNELALYREVEIGSGVDNLNGYWQLDSSALDETANNNDLTLVNTPVYDTSDVPFSSPTTRQDLDQSLNTSGNTYTTPTSISEAATAKQSFVPAKDPQKSVEILVADKGTGDWTVTVHDALNRTITSATIVNANVIVGDNEFTFSSAWRPVIGATYHFHVTSTVADGTVTTTTNADLETVDFHTYYQFLVDYNYHPMEHHAEKLCIGNERYLATWDGATYDPDALTLPSGYKIRCLAVWREFLVMGVVRGDNIWDYDVGYLFFWDGYSTTYNFYITVPQGGVNTMTSGDPLYFMAGYSGDLMKYEGGKPQKIRRMPFLSTKKYLEFAPKSMCSWRALTHIGMGLTTDSSDIYQGVYSYGTLNERLSESLSFDYPTSTSILQDTNLKIGLVYPIGSTLMIAWQYYTSYGVDAVKPTNNPFAIAKYQSLITDAGKIYQEKQALTLRGYFKALVSGDEMTLGYKIDRESSWNEGTAVTTADAKEARLSFPTKGGRFDELQTEVIMETTNTTSPEFYGLGIEIDDMTHERRV